MFKNLDKIHPIKRKELLQRLEALHELNLKNKVIDKVIVFGSSTRNDCTKKSDIDICFISDYPIRTIEYYNIASEFSYNIKSYIDSIDYRLVNGLLKDEIDNNGVEVYEYTND
ncbi:MAG: nucleotidyltransferase domain-containing protein [Treponema sp.]|nr:nucleotidyltransferase domain-containing protein [Treponema sp.]